MSRRVRVDVEPMRVVVAERTTLARSVFAAVAILGVAGTLHLRAIDPPRRDDVVWPGMLFFEAVVLWVGLVYVGPRRIVVVDRGTQEVRAELRFLGVPLAARKASLHAFRGAHWRRIDSLRPAEGSGEAVGTRALGLALGVLGGVPGNVFRGLGFVSDGDRPAELSGDAWEAIGYPERSDVEQAVRALADLVPRSLRGRRAS